MWHRLADAFLNGRFVWTFPARGAAFYTRNNSFKVQFNSASIALAPTISSRRQRSYENPRLPRVVELRLPCTKSQLARDSRLLPQPCGGNMTVLISSVIGLCRRSPFGHLELGANREFQGGYVPAVMLHEAFPLTPV